MLKVAKSQMVLSFLYHLQKKCTKSLSVSINFIHDVEKRADRDFVHLFEGGKKVTTTLRFSHFDLDP